LQSVGRRKCCASPTDLAPFRCLHAQSNVAASPASIYERTHLSIVVLATVDKDNKPIGQGSGFVVAKDRIITNHRVLTGATNVIVFFADGESVVVDGIVSDSPKRDLAVISAKTGSRSPLGLGDELSVPQGDYVYAIGAPKGLQLSITNGIVSGFRQVDEQFMIQSTAPIAPGSSGGPLFDSEGCVVGVTTSLLTDAPGIYFSVGAGDVSRLLRTPNTVVMPISSLATEGGPEAKLEPSGETEAVQKLINDKSYASAKDLAKAPEDPDLNRMIGEVDFFQGDGRSALVHLKSALHKNPQDAEALTYYAFELFLAGRYSEAEQSQQSLVRIAPNDFTLGLLSQTYYAEKKFKEAEETALQGLAKNPAEETSLSVIAGNIYWNRSASGMTWKDVLSKLANVSQSSYWVKINQATAFLNQNKEKEAIDLLQGAKKNLFPDPVSWVVNFRSHLRQTVRAFTQSTLCEGPFLSTAAYRPPRISLLRYSLPRYIAYPHTAAPATLFASIVYFAVPNTPGVYPPPKKIRKDRGPEWNKNARRPPHPLNP